MQSLISWRSNPWLLQMVECMQMTMVLMPTFLRSWRMFFLLLCFKSMRKSSKLQRNNQNCELSSKIQWELHCIKSFWNGIPYNLPEIPIFITQWKHTCHSCSSSSDIAFQFFVSSQAVQLYPTLVLLEMWYVLMMHPSVTGNVTAITWKSSLWRSCMSYSLG